MSHFLKINFKNVLQRISGDILFVRQEIVTVKPIFLIPNSVNEGYNLVQVKKASSRGSIIQYWIPTEKKYV